MKTFFLRQDSNYDKNYGKKDWLYINNLGYYNNVSKDINSSRPIPREDYHILYVLHGQMHINGMILNDGDSYLFLPNEPHSYTYKKIDNSYYFWIHFTGNKVKEILSYCDITKGLNKNNDRKQEKDSILTLLISELSNCGYEASDFATSLFFSFLSLFKTNKTQKNLYMAAVKMLEKTDEEVSISSIAKLYNITSAHFIRSFKKHYGITPNEYKQNFRITKAINLLKMTNLSIQDIAYQCGFNDSFYFSRVFKKKVGASPLKYRK